MLFRIWQDFHLFEWMWTGGGVNLPQLSFSVELEFELMALSHCPGTEPVQEQGPGMGSTSSGVNWSETETGTQCFLCPAEILKLV